MNLDRKQISSMLILMMACIGITGCMAASAVLATTRSTDQFVSYAADPRVLYEPGAEELAQNVAEALPAAIQTVQRAQYRDFVMPVKIYVCASLESFKAYGAQVAEKEVLCSISGCLFPPNRKIPPSKYPKS